MRSLSKNVKKDPQEYVYQGSKNMKIRDRSKLICEVCRKTSSKFCNLSILIDTYRCFAAIYIVSLRAIICLMGDYWTIGLYCDKPPIMPITTTKSRLPPSTIN